MIDVVIPAWNEAGCLAACLASVLQGADGLDVLLVVVANGCQDGTADIARMFQPVAAALGHQLAVLELERADKPSALNAAQPHLRDVPCVYLDADAVLGPGALRAMAEALAGIGSALLIAPTRVTVRPLGRLSRGYSRVREALPNMREGVVGGGCYAVSPQGRRRWQMFPDLGADDAYVRSLFRPEEQRVLLGADLLCLLPDDALELAGLARRWRRGNAELRRRTPDAPVASLLPTPWSARRALLRTLAAPTVLANLPAHLAVAALSFLPAARGRWPRSSRPAPLTTSPCALVTPKVHVVIVTHQSRELVGTCLSSVRSRAAHVVVTVVDNASNDGTRQTLTAEHPSVHVVSNAENRGFAAAVNQVAGRVPSDFLLLLNPDVQLRAYTLDHLLALALRLPEAGLYGGRALAVTGRVDPTSCLARPSLRQAASFGSGASSTGWPLLEADSLFGWQRDDTRHVPVLTGAALLVSTLLWEALDGLDERFFLYGEDVDLCLRARARGARPAFSHRAVYTHLGGASSTQHDRLTRILRSKLLLYDKHLRSTSGRAARTLLVLGVWLRAQGGAVLGGNQVWRSTWNNRSEWQHG